MGDKKAIARTATIILGVLLLLMVVFITSPPDSEVLLLYIVMSIGAYLVYRLSVFKDKLIPLSFKKKHHFGRSVLAGVIGGGAFFFVTKLIPGLSLGLPLLPGNISEGFRISVILIGAPFFEEIFFRGAVLGFFRNTTLGRRNIWFAIIAQAMLFAGAHLGAYVLGFYNYPSFTTGLNGIILNISAFSAAAIFGTISGFIVTRKGTRNLWFAIIFHALLNLIIFTSLSVIFVGSLFLSLVI